MGKAESGQLNSATPRKSPPNFLSLLPNLRPQARCRLPKSPSRPFGGSQFAEKTCLIRTSTRYIFKFLHDPPYNPKKNSNSPQKRKLDQTEDRSTWKPSATFTPIEGGRKWTLSVAIAASVLKEYALAPRLSYNTTKIPLPS